MWEHEHTLLLIATCPGILYALESCLRVWQWPQFRKAVAASHATVSCTVRVCLVEDRPWCSANEPLNNRTPSNASALLLPVSRAPDFLAFLTYPASEFPVQGDNPFQRDSRPRLTEAESGRRPQAVPTDRDAQGELGERNPLTN